MIAASSPQALPELVRCSYRLATRTPLLRRRLKAGSYLPSVARFQTLGISISKTRWLCSQTAPLYQAVSTRFGSDYVCS